MKSSKDPEADELRNKNLNKSAEEIKDQPIQPEKEVSDKNVEV